ncbi:MAG: site-2 protease family protein [Candidatus Gracilibacteria bacterium]|jgi:regulator of sigma E protease|nr:site-2 protease family protein [Candidatus Gracilibacteria bacterium]
MSYLLTAIVFILIFSVLILIHELGHFVMAKRAGIKVEEFGFGLPPRIWGKKKGETIYSINLIPFGGFVRMLGEDSRDKKMLENKRSFIAQPMRSRVKVIVAGVTMNFLLAYAIITFGLIVGMEPLLLPDEILPKTAQGVIEVSDGVLVKSVSGKALEYGVSPLARLKSVDGRSVNTTNVREFLSGDFENYLFESDGKELLVSIPEEQSISDLGFEFYSFTAYPRIKVTAVSVGGVYEKAGMKLGDEIVSVNGVKIFGVEDFSSNISGLSEFDLEIVRDGKSEVLKVASGESKSIVASFVLSKSPAEKGGLVQGDVVRAVNGKSVVDVSELISEISSTTEDLDLTVFRSGEVLELVFTPENGKIGVVLGSLYSFENLSGISIYVGDALSSILKVQDEKYPFYIAPIKAFEHSYNLSKVTASMFVGFVKNLFANGEVPEGVSGPVGIAQMTHVFVKDGFMSILRFVALLSLSLAVINILPIPALDGGRLLFIIVELFTGKKVNQKVESYIHLAGYLFVLGLILLVTFSDIMRILGK